MTENHSPYATLRALSNRTAPPVEVVFLRRVSFGIAPKGHYSPIDKGDLAAFLAGGNNLTSRVNAWVNKQLNIPSDVVRMDIANRISDTYRAIDLTVAQEWNQFFRRRGKHKDEVQWRPLSETELLSFEREVYSKYQLFERLSMFWHDHFNVYGPDYYPRSTFCSWNRTIRSHVLGNFYQFLLNTAEHPAMLFYLDNYENSRNGPNENYARELLELHTLGTMNYFGLMSQTDVPVYKKSDGVPAKWVGKPKGYVDEDVYETTRMMTGWHIDNRDAQTDTGEFKYRDVAADQFQKFILGHRYPANGNGEEYKKARYGSSQEDGKLRQGRHLLWQLATHPGTARHIAWKLAKHFLNDKPPEALISAITKTFLDNVEQPDQLKQCYMTLFKHSAMRDRSTWGNQKARPTEMVVHACRIMGCQRDFRPFGLNESRDSSVNKQEYEARQSHYFINYFMGLTGHRQFHWRPPDGFPLEAEYWLSTNSVVQTWKVIEKISEYYSYIFVNKKGDLSYPLTTILPITLEALPKRAEQTPENVVLYWATRAWGFKPEIKEIQPIINFFCQPIEAYELVSEPWSQDFPISDGQPNGKTIDSDKTPHRWCLKLRLMVAAVMMHPYAMLR